MEHLTASLDYILEKESLQHPLHVPSRLATRAGPGGLVGSDGISLARLLLSLWSYWRTSLGACVVSFSAEKPDGNQWWAEFQGFDARAATLVIWGEKINIVENPRSHSLNDDKPSGFKKDGLASHRCERDRGREGRVHSPPPRHIQVKDQGA